MRPSSPTEIGASAPDAVPEKPTPSASGRNRGPRLRRLAQQWIVGEVLGDLLKTVLSQGLDWLGGLLP